MQCPPRRLLVGVDFSEASREAVRYAAGLVAALGGELTLLHVVDNAPILNASPLVGGAPPGSLADLPSVETEAMRAVERMASDSAPGAQCEVRVGSPAQELCARASDADLLLVGAHGKRALRHLLLGSTSEQTMRRSPVPVLIIRA